MGRNTRSPSELVTPHENLQGVSPDEWFSTSHPHNAGLLKGEICWILDIPTDLDPNGKFPEKNTKRSEKELGRTSPVSPLPGSENRGGGRKPMVRGTLKPKHTEVPGCLKGTGTERGVFTDWGDEGWRPFLTVGLLIIESVFFQTGD